MSIQNIGTIYATVGEVLPNSKTGQSSPVSTNTNNADYIPPGVDARTDISQTARTLNQLDGTLSDMGQAVSKMKGQLQEIRRTLPPFKPEDAERVRLLRGYIGLRKLIDELTVPHPTKSDQVKEGLDLPVLTDKATDQEIDGAIRVLDKTELTLQKNAPPWGFWSAFNDDYTT